MISHQASKRNKWNMMKIFRFKVFACVLASAMLIFSALSQTNQPIPPPPPVANPAVPSDGTPFAGRHVSLRVVGSNVRNSQGEYLGRIEEILINLASGQIDFALVSTSYPTNSPRVTPVPWPLLGYVWDQSQAGGLPGALQTFRLNLDKARLDQAPTISRMQRADLGQFDWMQSVYAFFGVPSPGAVGGTGTAAGVTGGAAAGAPAQQFGVNTGTGAAAGQGTAPNYLPNNYSTPGVIVVGPGFTNATGTNVIVGTNAIGGVTNFPPGTTNVFPGTTNVFPGTTNAFPGTTNPFQGGGNIFPGAPSGLSPGATNSPNGTALNPTTSPRTPATQPGQPNSPVTPSTPNATLPQTPPSPWKPFIPQTPGQTSPSPGTDTTTPSTAPATPQAPAAPAPAAPATVPRTPRVRP